jgi:hypothetical protein
LKIEMMQTFHPSVEFLGSESVQGTNEDKNQFVTAFLIWRGGTLRIGGNDRSCTVASSMMGKSEVAPIVQFPSFGCNNLTDLRHQARLRHFAEY